jgi:hypothetical protein
VVDGYHLGKISERLGQLLHDPRMLDASKLDALRYSPAAG